MGWMEGCMHVCNIDLTGLFVATDQSSTTSTRRLHSANGSSPKTETEKQSNQKKVHEISSRKTRDKNGRPNGWRKVKIESVSQKRDGGCDGMDVDGDHPEQVPDANDGFHTTIANGIKQKVEVKPTMDKYQGVEDRKPIDYFEIETSDSASEITLPDSLNGILTSFFGFHYTYDEVTQPELEHLEISLTQNEIDERREKEDVQQPTDETSLVVDKDIPIQKQEESTPSGDKRQEDESKAHQSMSQEKTSGITKIKNGNSKGKISLDGRSETREPDTPIHDQHPQINTKHRDTDTRDDDDADIGKNHDRHHEGQPKPLDRVSDKYQPFHHTVKDLSAKEAKLQSKKEGIDNASVTTPYKTNTVTTDNETNYYQPSRAHNQPSVGVRAISQAYRHGRSQATPTSNHIPNPVLRLSLDIDGQRNKHSPHGSSSVDETSRQDVDRIKPETSIVTNDQQSSPDAFPFVPSRATQVRPGSLRL